MASELLPTCRIVAEPFTKFGAGWIPLAAHSSPTRTIRRGDWILDYLAGSWRHELNATRALLTFLGTVLIFGGLVGEFGWASSAIAVVEMMAPANAGTVFNNDRRQTPFLVERDGLFMRALLALPRNEASLTK